MKVTDVKIVKINEESEARVVATTFGDEGVTNYIEIKADVSVTFDDELVVNDIKVIEVDRELFIAMPSRKNINGESKDIVYPTKSTVLNMMQEAIIAEYKKVTAQFGDTEKTNL